MIYETCEKCGAHLDPGELCSCEKTEEKNDFREKELGEND